MVTKSKSCNYDEWYEDYEVTATIVPEFNDLSEMEQYDVLNSLDYSVRTAINERISEKCPDHSKMRRDRKLLNDTYGKNIGATDKIGGDTIMFIADENNYEVDSEYQYYKKNGNLIDIENLQEANQFKMEYDDLGTASKFVGEWKCQNLAKKNRTTKLVEKDGQKYIAMFIEDEEAPAHLYLYNDNDSDTLFDLEGADYICLISENELKQKRVDMNGIEGYMVFGRAGSGIEGYILLQNLTKIIKNHSSA